MCTLYHTFIMYFDFFNTHKCMYLSHLNFPNLFPYGYIKKRTKIYRSSAYSTIAIYLHIFTIWHFNLSRNPGNTFPQYFNSKYGEYCILLCEYFLFCITVPSSFPGTSRLFLKRFYLKILFTKIYDHNLTLT